MTAAIAERTARRPQPGWRRSTKPQTNRTPELRVIDQQATRRRARQRNALLGLFLAVLAGFFVVAFVHADLVAGQQQLDTVRAEIVEAELHQAELARLVEQDSAPDVIVARAMELGMVPANEPVFLAAVAPRPDVTVQTPLPEATEPPSPTGDGSPDPSVASPGLSDGSPMAIVSGTVDVAGGVTAAVRVELGADQRGPDPADDPTDLEVADLEVVASPVGATSDTSGSSSASAATPVAPAASEPPADPEPSTEPSGSLAGSRAVSTSASGPGGG